MPADLETVVLKAMAKRREDRYTTAQELADDLHRVLEGKPTVARPPSPCRAAGWARRHRAVVAAASVGLLAMLGIGGQHGVDCPREAQGGGELRPCGKALPRGPGTVDRLGKRLADRLARCPGRRSAATCCGKTLRYYPAFGKGPGQPRVSRRLALTYSKIGSLTAEIGSIADAIDAHRHAIGFSGFGGGQSA